MTPARPGHGGQPSQVLQRRHAARRDDRAPVRPRPPRPARRRPGPVSVPSRLMSVTTNASAAGKSLEHVEQPAAAPLGPPVHGQLPAAMIEPDRHGHDRRPPRRRASATAAQPSPSPPWPHRPRPASAASASTAHAAAGLHAGAPRHRSRHRGDHDGTVDRLARCAPRRGRRRGSSGRRRPRTPTATATGSSPYTVSRS